MRKLTVFNSVTLDGVMQAPGRPDEDRRGWFTSGGWAVPRRTYEDFFSFGVIIATSRPAGSVQDKEEQP